MYVCPGLSGPPRFVRTKRPAVCETRLAFGSDAGREFNGLHGVISLFQCDAAILVAELAWRLSEFEQRQAGEHGEVLALDVEDRRRYIGGGDVEAAFGFRFGGTWRHSGGFEFGQADGGGGGAQQLESFQAPALGGDGQLQLDAGTSGTGRFSENLAGETTMHPPL